VGENTVQVAAVEALDWNPELHEPAFGPLEPLVPPSQPQAEDPATEPPVFSPAQQPAEDGVGYPAADGRTYYRPGLRVADRAPGLLAGPDVWFQRDPQGGLRLDWALTTTRPAAVPADAVPLRLDVMQVRLLWEGGERLFDPPAAIPVTVIGPGAPEEPAVLLRGGTDLLPADARALELAMADAGSGCHLELHGSFAYAMFESGNGQLDYYLARYGMDVDLRGMDAALVLAMFDEHGWDADHRKAEGTDEDDFQAALPVLVEGRSLVVRQVPFVFDPRDEPNGPIYRALHGTATLSARWRRSAVGWVRDSGFPNTVYRLPDELRLAFNPDLGTPHVITTLYQGAAAGAAVTPAGTGSVAVAEGTVGVRVLMRVAPWQDPRQVVQTRELVGARTAQVVVGPVASAVLRLGGSFPEGIRVLGASGDGVPVPLTGAADLLLDLSLEYFQLLCGMIGGAVGLPGQVEVTLTDADPDAGAGDSGTVTVTVPVNLRMDTVQDLPVSVEVPTGSGSASGSASASGSGSSPTVVRITNRAGTAVRIGGCAAVFVQASDSSVVPLGTRPARCVSVFPVELAAGASAELALEAVDPRPDDWWNAVLVELLDKTMVEDAGAVLLRTNQVAGSGELTWSVRVSCPVFAAQPRPQRWTNLVALEVEITAPGFDTTTVVLDAATGATTITMRQPLADLVAGRSAGIRTATFRVRNNYTDHQGSWTAPQQQSGTHLIVYPNQSEND
jgi:hypothetical protein